MDQPHVGQPLIHRVEHGLEVFHILFGSQSEGDLFGDVVVGTDDLKGLAIA